MPRLRPATLEDCVFIAQRLRAADRAEIEALDGSDPEAAIIESFSRSVHCNVMEHNGEPFAIYGVTPDELCSDCTKGISWMLGTDDLARHSAWFLRNCAGMLEGMHEHFPLIHNVVDVRNEVHIRWLRWAGFTFGKQYPHNGTHFWEHWRTKECALPLRRR
jgi:hypothetical protein